MSWLDQLQQGVIAGGGLGATAFFVWRFLLWVTSRIDKRQEMLDAEHVALDMSWKEYRLLLERDRQEQRAVVARMDKQGRALRMSFEHVAGALIRVDPQNPALAIADRLLAAAFPDDFTFAAFRAEQAIRANDGEASA